MKTVHIYILLIISILFTTGCTIEELKDGEFATDEKRTLNLSTYQIEFGTELEQIVRIEGNNPWEIKNIPDWLTFSTLKGQNEDVRIVAEVNPSSENDREATIEVVSGFIKKEIKITQKKSEGILNVTPLTFGFGPEGGKDNLHIDCNGKWTIQTNSNWCHLSKTNGIGDVVLELTCDANKTNNQRTDTIYVNKATGMGTVKIPVIQSSTDLYIISGIKNLEFDGQGETIKFQLLSNVKWNITASHSWCQVSPIIGNGDQEISVTLGRNPNANERSATLTITSTTSGVSPIEVNITQYKGEEPRLTLSNKSTNFSNSGGTKTISVESNCMWHVEYNSDWFTATPTESVSGNGTITITARQNPVMAGKNEGVIYVCSELGREPISITQDPGDEPKLTLSSKSTNFSNSGGTKTISVESNITWHIEYTSTWFTATPTESTLGNGTITINAKQNPAMASKNEGTIYVCSELGREAISISQDPGVDGYITPSTTSINFNVNAQHTTFTVESNIDWSVSSSESWCTVSSNVTSLNGTVTVNVTKNTGTSVRTAKITLKSNAGNVTVTVNQDPLQVPGGDDNPNPNYAKKR